MDTHGWDIVSACSQSKLNALLKARLTKTPPTLSYDDGQGTTLDITFSPWQITAFGSNRALTLDMPVKSGTLTNGNKFAEKPSVDLAGVTMAVRIQLDFIDQAKGDASNLSFTFKAAATSAADKTDGAVFVQQADVTGQLAKVDPSGNSATVLHNHVADALVHNAAKLEIPLSVVNLAPAGGAAWMKPVEKAHMFGTGPKKANGAPGEGYLIVATMVRTLPAATRSLNFDETLFDTQHDVFMLLNKDLFLANVIQPNLPAAFKDSSAVNFQMMGDSIAGVGVLICPEVDHMGTGYDPFLTRLTISIDDDRLKSTAVGFFHITGLTHSSVTFNFTQYATCRYDSATQSIAFDKAQSPDPDYEKHIPWYLYAVASVALPFLGLIVGGIILAVVDVVIAAVTTGVASTIGKSSKTSGIASLSNIAVTWPGSTETKIAESGLSDGFYMRGDLS